MIYFIYIGIILIAIGISIVLWRKKQKISLFLTAIPTFLSFSCLFIYAQMNFFTEPCGGADECMNETGLWVVFAMLLIAVSVGIFTLALLNDRLRRKV